MKTETKQQLREQLDAANEKLIDAERRLKDSETQRESTQKRFLEKRERVEELESHLGIENFEPAMSTKYRVVHPDNSWWMQYSDAYITINTQGDEVEFDQLSKHCLLYTSPSPRDGLLSRMPSSA